MGEAPGLPNDHRFNEAANESPRSGSSKRSTPVVWGVVVIALVALAIWFAIGR
jgi:hypothetical protein